MPGGGEALRELLVEAEQAAHVGQDDDAGRAVGAGQVGAEVGAVGGRQRQALAGGAAGDDLKALGKVGHDRVKGKAHSLETYSCGVRTITASVVVEGPAVEVEQLWHDRSRWASWIDGFAHLSKLDDDWPHAGARRVWVTPPGDAA